MIYTTVGHNDRRLKLDQTKLFQAKYFTGENITIYSNKQMFVNNQFY